MDYETLDKKQKWFEGIFINNFWHTDFIETNTSILWNSNWTMTIWWRRPICFTCVPDLRWWQREVWISCLLDELTGYGEVKKGQDDLVGHDIDVVYCKVLTVDFLNQRLRRRKRSWRFISVTFLEHISDFLEFTKIFLFRSRQHTVFLSVSVDILLPRTCPLIPSVWQHRRHHQFLQHHYTTIRYNERTVQIIQQYNNTIIQ